MDKRKNS